ncbi:MAG: O-antigen translocase [Gammaproteobacteria bacterium]
MKSHRQIFRSSAIIGGASVINMVIGIVKVKVLAVLLGPIGIGLMGLYQNIMSMATMLAGCGVGRSAVRQFASSADDAQTLSIIRRALWMIALILGLTGMVLLWLLRESVAYWVFGDAGHASEIGWLGLGLLFSVIAGSQTSTLQGLRRISDMARVSILSALVSAVVGVLAVRLLGRDGVLWFVLMAPAANFLIALFYTARIASPPMQYELAAIQRQWLAMLKFGIPLMAAGLVTLLTQLAMRSVVFRELGLEASGYFQAAWAISFTYVGFVLNAMAMDYYPRLTMAIDDHHKARELVNEQIEMALLFIGPALIGMITLAPWVIHLLYAPSFSPAAEILKWQMLGGILKVVSAPLVFIFLSKGRGSIVVGVQFVWGVAYLAPVLFFISEFGLLTTGVGYWAAYTIYCVIVVALAHRLIGFTPSKRNVLLTITLLIVGNGVMSLVSQSVILSYAVGSLATLLLSVYSLRRLNQLIDLTGWLRQRFARD